MNANKERFLLFRVLKFRDKESFSELMMFHGPKLKRFLVIKLPTVQDADDAYSIVSLRIWSYLTSSNVESLSGLVFTIARGAVAEFYRSQKVELVSIESAGESLEILSKEDGSLAEARVDVMFVRKALQKLKDEEQQAIIMRYFEGHSIRRVAQELNKTEGATSVFLYRTIKKLRGLLEEKI